jgi:hypothetical protein
MAVSKGLAARRAIQSDPTLTGEGKANIAIILGIAAVAMWIINMVAKGISRAH